MEYAKKQVRRTVYTKQSTLQRRNTNSRDENKDYIRVYHNETAAYCCNQSHWITCWISTFFNVFDSLMTRLWSDAWCSFQYSVDLHIVCWRFVFHHESIPRRLLSFVFCVSVLTALQWEWCALCWYVNDDAVHYLIQKRCLWCTWS